MEASLMPGTLGARYKHTNLVARDWKSLARFYEDVFGCVRVPPERHISGSWLARGTGVPNARCSGVHLRLPGHGRNGPTLEIFQYARNEKKPPAEANREGFAHIAFEVRNVEKAVRLVMRHGGRKIGDIAVSAIAGVGTLTFAYVADPEDNIIELQSWNFRARP
jgi:catechol 2,3-dioxygenase-like lactoylglutathione lyase family enzyme